ncbi:purine-cytosine permease family protein, partial [Aquitalea magnusonii]|uniref:purine-cytosine permease family protein n=1 Tax=Aquitalea magnusonii TaxID=332411 RepID=UPI000A6EB8BD
LSPVVAVAGGQYRLGRCCVFSGAGSRGCHHAGDYALRFTPRRFRQWSLWRVANTALGGAASFLVLEAVGATMLVQAGFFNALLAILLTGLVILLAGLPISVYAARYGVDMDLLTRGAGFGYIGSTVTSLIYASFTFIFFALEAAIMAYALELGFGIPPVAGYLLCALLVLPLVTHGVTAISRLQSWTQPLWLLLLVLPYAFLLWQEPAVLQGLWHYPGGQGAGMQFDLRSELYNRAPYDAVRDRLTDDASLPIQHGLFYHL